MYKTTLSDAEVSNLRQHGFIHITGFPYKVGDATRFVHFKRDMWGKWYDNWLGRTVVIAKNGEVWLRLGKCSDREILETLSSVCPKGTTEDYEITQRQYPYLFYPHADFTVWSSELLERVAHPYGPDCVHDPDPTHHES